MLAASPAARGPQQRQMQQKHRQRGNNARRRSTSPKPQQHEQARRRNRRTRAPVPSSAARVHAYRVSLLIYVSIVIVSVFALYGLYGRIFPKGVSAVPGCIGVWDALGLPSFLVAPSTNQSLTLPERVFLVWECAETIRGAESLVLMCLFWVFLKGLAIPGSMVLCVALGGLMQNPIQAQVIATACEVLGGSLCYALSGTFGKPLLERFFPVYLAKFQQATKEKRASGDLFYFALFVRMTPLVPNWFVNAASPSVGIPYPIFVLSMVLGIQIATFLSIRTGTVIMELGAETLHGNDSLLNHQLALNVGIIFTLSFVPLLLQRWQQRKQRG